MLYSVKAWEVYRSCLAYGAFRVFNVVMPFLFEFLGSVMPARACSCESGGGYPDGLNPELCQLIKKARK